MEISDVLNKCEENFENSLKKLGELAAIDSVSFDGFDKENVYRCSELVKSYFEELGFSSRCMNLEGTFPCVFAESEFKEGLPTVLLYAHYDVQPPMRLEKWHSPPFTPTERDGRLYGRGCADDKAGIMVHFASIAAYIESVNTLPVNIKCLIEGEEEIGSPNLEKYIEKLGDEFSADVVIIADVSNYDVGKPAIVNSLRGNLCCEVQLNSLKAPLHSGMWGGPIPDVSQAMAKVLASLSDKNGLINIEGIYENITPLSETEQKSLDSLNYTEEDLREQSGFFTDTKLIDDEKNPLESIWRRPSITVTSMLSGDKKNAGNVIQDEAWARISMRLVPGMDPDDCFEKLKTHIQNHTPWGMKLKIKSLHRDPAWLCSAESSVFETALEALTEGFNQQAVVIGCGGSIPLVNTIEAFIGKIPILLTGIEDPYTQAHSENESLHIGDFKSAIRSQIILFDKLGKTLKKLKG